MTKNYRSKPTGIKILRISKGLLQTDLERLTGIKQPRLSRLERGRAKPTLEEQKALEKAFERNASR